MKSLSVFVAVGLVTVALVSGIAAAAYVAIQGLVVGALFCLVTWLVDRLP